LTQLKTYSARRISSWDTTGGNWDAWFIEPGEVKVLADIEGPGVISHIWFTVTHDDPHYLRKIVLRMYWDDEPYPSVETPLGDFFGLGHGQVFTYQCALFSTSTNYGTGIGGTDGPGVAMNCWVPMPFAKRARIEIVNEQEVPIRAFYFYIDYQKHESLGPSPVYFHAKWRRENPCDGWKGEGSIWGSEAWKERMRGPEGINKSDEGNYLILEAEGQGHYIGVNFSIDRYQKGWWGEGDDMIFIDRGGKRDWPPDMHGTGSEDYIGHAWGMQSVAHLYSGQPWAEEKDHFNRGKICVYRYHVLDPIPFTKDIRVSIEHGHANNRSDDISSVAYWYQVEPHREFCKLLPVALRLPNPL
jgi:hypothetical protein